MRSILFVSAAAALALIATDPAFCMRDMNPSQPADSTAPEHPASPEMPPQPTERELTPPPSDPMPMPQPPMERTPAPQPPVQGSTDAPVGPMATPPGSNAPVAQSGGTTSAMMTPQPATKEYPLCTREIQDSCRNPGEGPKTMRKPR